MSTISHTAIINAPNNDVWGVLNDFENMHKWHHMVEHSELISSNNRGIGAIRKIRMYDGKELKERVIDYKDGEFMRLEFLDHGMPAKKIEAEFRTRKVSDSKTEVTVAMDQVLKFGIFGKFLNNVVMAPMVRKLYRKLLDGLEKHILTGKVIGKDGNPSYEGG